MEAVDFNDFRLSLTASHDSVGSFSGGLGDSGTGASSSAAGSSSIARLPLAFLSSSSAAAAYHYYCAAAASMPPPSLLSRGGARAYDSVAAASGAAGEPDADRDGPRLSAAFRRQLVQPPGGFNMSRDDFTAPWFHRDASRAGAERLLRAAASGAGSFLVRPSSKQHAFALSFVDESGAIQHNLIRGVWPDGYVMTGSAGTGEDEVHMSLHDVLASNQARFRFPVFPVARHDDGGSDHHEQKQQQQQASVSVVVDRIVRALRSTPSAGNDDPVRLVKWALVVLDGPADVARQQQAAAVGAAAPAQGRTYVRFGAHECVAPVLLPLAGRSAARLMAAVQFARHLSVIRLVGDEGYMRRNFRACIGDREAVRLARALRHNRTVTVLDLHVNRVGDAGAVALARAAQTPGSSITELDLSTNFVGAQGLAALLAALPGKERWRSAEISFLRSPVEPATTAAVCIGDDEVGLLLDNDNDEDDEWGGGDDDDDREPSSTTGLVHFSVAPQLHQSSRSLGDIVTTNSPETLAALDLIEQCAVRRDELFAGAGGVAIHSWCTARQAEALLISRTAASALNGHFLLYLNPCRPHAVCLAARAGGGRVLHAVAQRVTDGYVLMGGGPRQASERSREAANRHAAQLSLVERCAWAVWGHAVAAANNDGKDDDGNRALSSLVEADERALWQLVGGAAAAPGYEDNGGADNSLIRRLNRELPTDLRERVRTVPCYSAVWGSLFRNADHVTSHLSRGARPAGTYPSLSRLLHQNADWLRTPLKPQAAVPEPATTGEQRVVDFVDGPDAAVTQTQTQRFAEMLLKSASSNSMFSLNL